MPSKIAHALLMIMATIALLIATVIVSYADTVTYIYDEVNRLKRVIYDNGTVIEYTYDEVGNRLQEIVQRDTTPPTGAIFIDDGASFTNTTSVALILFCNDPNICSQMQFSFDSITYSTPEPFTSTKILTLPFGSGVQTVYVKFKDAVGNWSNPIADTISACSSSSAMIGSTSYTTLQAAYDAAQDNNVIKSLGMRLIEDINIYGNKVVTLEGGYDCGFTTNIGGMTFVKSLTTRAGGGKLTIKNFVVGDAVVTDATPPITTATPAGGTYPSARSVMLSCNDGAGSGCDKIYYTTNGSTPTTSSPVYSSPINISATTTLKFFAKDVAGNAEAVKTEVYTITTDTTPPTTTATPAGGTYSTAQSVALTCTDTGGSGCDKIYYTTDGSAPTTSSPVYSSPINISVTTTLKFFAKDLAGNSEAVKTQTYTINIDTTAPTTIASPTGGIYNTSQSITLTCNDASGSGCDKIYYTTDGSAPTTSSPVYSSPINILFSTTLKFFARNLAGNSEAVKTQNYTIDGTPPTTTSSPTGGIYNNSQSVTLTCSDTGGSGCDKIYYTVDGSTPSTSSPIYSTAINITTTTTLKFFARDLAGNSEAVKTQTYTIDTSLPTGTITINSGVAYTNSINVTLTLSCNDANGCSQMQFSNDNVTYSTPEVYATSKAWSLTTADGTKTVYVKFKDTPGNWSMVYTNTILLDTTLPTTTATPAGGTYSSAQSVTLSCSDGTGSGCDKIYYTVDGSTPTTSSPVYSSPINISVTTTLKFFAKDIAGNSEAVKTQTYTVNTGGGPTLTSIDVSPSSASVAPNGTQQFTATGKDQFGNVISPQPSFTWTVSGGGTISSSGLFTAGSTAGGPFTVTAASGGVSGTASVTVTSASTFTIGETTILSLDNGGDGNLLVAYQVTLGQTATIFSMSFYVTTASGNLRLGIYDATGPGGGPGALKAQTAEFTPVSGWNTRNVVSQVTLPAGTYWLAYLPSSNNLGFRSESSGGSARYYSYTYGALPATFSTSPSSNAYRNSFYATLQ